MAQQVLVVTGIDNANTHLNTQ